MSNDQKRPIYKRWWFIALAAILVIGALSNNGSEERAASSTAPATTSAAEDSARASEDSFRSIAEARAAEYVVQQAAEREGRVRSLIEAGLVQKMDRELREVYVEPSIWHMLNVDQKENAARIMGQYFGDGLSEICEVFDYRSGKRLAKIGVLGFKVD